jgi:competence ComEA-like helix-hairpin-helix protein
MQIKKLVNLIGFTQTEFKVILFLAAVFIFGLLIKLFNIDKTEYKNFDYSREDSIFWASDTINTGSENLSLTNDEKNKYKKDVLGYGGNKRFEIKKKELPAESSINLNTAAKEELIKLPGIGEKTATQIIELRTIKGKFTNVEELMEVKGIQNAKLEKIRKYIYVR